MARRGSGWRRTPIYASNDLKRAHAEGTDEEYAVAKREFFRLNFPKPS